MTDDESPVTCALVRLSTADVGNVAVCRGCGTVHLSLSGVTLRMHPRAFLEVARMADQARSGLLRIAGVAKDADEAGRTADNAGKEGLH